MHSDTNICMSYHWPGTTPVTRLLGFFWECRLFTFFNHYLKLMLCKFCVSPFSESWFASCSDKLLRFSRGGNGSPGTTYYFCVHWLDIFGVCTLRIWVSFSINIFFILSLSFCLTCSLLLPLSLSSAVNQFLQVFTDQILQNTDHVPKGLILHILDLYMAELAQVGSAEVRPAEGCFLHFNF